MLNSKHHGTQGSIFPSHHMVGTNVVDIWRPLYPYKNSSYHRQQIEQSKRRHITQSTPSLYHCPFSVRLFSSQRLVFVTCYNKTYTAVAQLQYSIFMRAEGLLYNNCCRALKTPWFPSTKSKANAEILSSTLYYSAFSWLWTNGWNSVRYVYGSRKKQIRRAATVYLRS